MSSIKKKSFDSKQMDASRKFLRQPKKPIVMSTAATLKVLYEDNHIIAVNKRSSDIIQGDTKDLLGRGSTHDEPTRRSHCQLPEEELPTK